MVHDNNWQYQQYKDDQGDDETYQLLYPRGGEVVDVFILGFLTEFSGREKLLLTGQYYSLVQSLLNEVLLWLGYLVAFSTRPRSSHRTLPIRAPVVR